MANIPYKIIVHHTADPSETPQLAKVNRLHEARGFPRSELGFFVGYHFLVERDGSAIQTRKESEYGAHDAGENINTLGVALAGNFSLHTPTKEQVAALGELLVRLSRRYGLTALDIEPHRRHDTTECYGTLLADNWASYVYIQAEINIIRKILSWVILEIAAIAARKK